MNEGSIRRLNPFRLVMVLGTFLSCMDVISLVAKTKPFGFDVYGMRDDMGFSQMLTPATNVALPRRPPPPKKRILLGIMSADFPSELEYRKQFRELFAILASHQDTRACSLGNFEAEPDSRRDCELVYTFVLGGNAGGLTELVNDSVPLLVAKDQLVTASPESMGPVDKWETDMTFLNIRENMEEGKSQTWFYRAQQLIQLHNFDYVAKCDSDSVLNLPRLFEFAAGHLPPAPFNQGILVGKPCDKLWWRNWRQSPTKYSPEEKQAKEGYLRDRYGQLGRWSLIFHLYALGQFYLLSPDLVDTVVLEASSQNYKLYAEGIEDHDISTMAFHSNKPIHFIFLSNADMQFWEHGVKLNKKEEWERIWKKAKDDLKESLSA